MPSLTPAAAWLMPWDYAMDLLAAAGVRERRRAVAAGERVPAVVREGHRRLMSDGRPYPSGMSAAAAMFGM